MLSGDVTRYWKEKQLFIAFEDVAVIYLNYMPVFLSRVCRHLPQFSFLYSEIRITTVISEPFICNHVVDYHFESFYDEKAIL